MSEEARLKKLEAQHKALDANQHSLAKVCADIKTIALTNQHDIAGIKACITALAEATHAGFERADKQHNEFVKETRERFDQLDGRVDRLEDRMDKLDSRMDRLEGRMDKLDSCMDRLEGRMDKVESRLDKIDNRLDKIDTRFDQLELLIRQSLSSN